MKVMERVDQKTAQTLFLEGATCYFLGFPVGSELGIDLKYYQTAEKFCGLKMIPPGLHFIYYSVVNSHGDHSPRVGFFHIFQQREILVKKWDSTQEVFIDEDNLEVVERLKTNLKNMDRFLGPYDYDIWERWKNLSDEISSDLLNKMVPLCGRIHSVLELKGKTFVHSNCLKELVQQASSNDYSKDDKCNTTSSKRQKTKLFICDEISNDMLPKLEAAEGTEIRFSKIPNLCYPENSTPSEITKHSLDSSYLLQQILLQHVSNTDILGELQLAFICFLIGHSFEAFEHWKRLLGILCACDDAINIHSEIFSGFIKILTFELQEIQEDFLVDIVEGSNIVYKNLRIFFRNLYASSTNGRLKSKAKRFQEFLTKKLNWSFSDIFQEDDEDLPVVVNLEN